MTRPSFNAIAHAAERARRKKRLARALLALGCDPRATLGGVERRAQRDLRRLSEAAQPYIQSGESLGAGA